MKTYECASQILTPLKLKHDSHLEANILREKERERKAQKSTEQLKPKLFFKSDFVLNLFISLNFVPKTK